MTSLLKINDLSCSYNNGATVLRINNLEIEKGKIIFILGSSGSGKSTLLETLGLMNNTISNGDVALIQPDNKCINYTELWKKGNEKQLNDIRKDFLSFIFQNTNLMENFTAYENICLSQMIKNDISQEKVMIDAMELMKQVGLPLNEVGTAKLSVNLSGGQRQRVAFVRALNNDFKILLCDEPTGNLDEVNANELIHIVKKNINTERTAILVSHDINLALKHADQIVIISKNKQTGFGEVLTSNVFEREAWREMNLKQQEEFRDKILQLFSSDTKGNVNHETASQILENPSYRKLFIKKESKVLYGKNFFNLAILVAIIAITLLAIGFANGALDYVDRKLNDTFVNWVTVPIPPFKSGSNNVGEMLSQLNDSSVKTTFALKTVTAYKVTALKFFDHSSDEADYIKGRLINMDDPLVADLFSNKNYVSGKKRFQSDRDIGIVVTEKFLKKFHYPEDAKVVYMDNSDTLSNATKHFKVPVPVVGLIKEIPGRSSFIITEFFFQSYCSATENVFDFKEQNKRILIYCQKKEVARKLKMEIEKAVTQLPTTEQIVKEEDHYAEEIQDVNVDETNTDRVDSKNEEVNLSLSAQKNDTSICEIVIDVNIDTCEQVSSGGYEVSVNLDPRPSNPFTTEKIFDAISQLAYYKENTARFIRLFDYGIATDVEGEINNDYLSINFNKGGLDHIEPFAQYMNKSLNSGEEKGDNNLVEMDSGLIKEKNNFSYLSKMTLLIILLLVIFSILSISLFISNLLRSHLNKIKMNLGTFKAFGLSDITSQKIYQLIMLRFMILALVMGLVLAYATGSIIENYFSYTVKIDDEITYFKLWDIQTLLLVIVIMLVTWGVSVTNIKKILSRTPGDLIYNR